MRVLHVFKCALPESMGGIEQVIHQIAIGAASRHGVQTDVLALSKVSSKQQYAGYTLHWAKRDVELASTGFSLKALSKFRQLAAKADVVHYHFPWPMMDLMHLVVRPAKPTVLTYHSDVVRQKLLLKVYLPLMRWMLGQVDHIVATSPNYFATSNVLAKLAHKTSVIPIGLNKAAYPVPEPHRLAHWKQRLGEKFFLFVGVIRYYKGLHLLLDAAQGAPYPIVIMGAGPIEQELKEQAHRLALNNVVFLGALPDEDKVALLQLCLGVVFPSHLRSEAFGISLLEGAMFGKPMISSEIGTGTTFVNMADETGLVVPPSDSRALRAAMDELWNNPDKAERMGQNAEARYWKLFTAEKMVDAYVDLYKDLMRPSSR